MNLSTIQEQKNKILEFNKFYQSKMEFFSTEVKCINKKNDTICNKMHYLKYMKDSASDW